jgi:beta-lactamase regulating signal transducer with metallopeptidase domain
VNWLIDVGLSNAAAACMLAVAACLIGRLSRRPAVVHAAWLLVILKLLTPPLFRVPVLPGERSPERVVERGAVASTHEPVDIAAPIDSVVMEVPEVEVGLDESVEAEEPASVVASAPASELSVIESGWSWPAWGWRVWVGGAWALGSLIWCGITVRRVLRLRGVLREAEREPEEIEGRVETLAFELGLRRAPETRLVEGRVGPFVWALGRRAVLVVPRGLWKRLDDDQRTTLLLHELAHLRRGDHWVRLLELLATGLYWWHPVLWLARSRLHAAEEECCDAWVVWARPMGAEVYARALVEAVEFLTGVGTKGEAVPIGVSGLGRLRHVSRRIVMIMRGDVARGMSVSGIVLIVGLTAALPWQPTRASGGGQAVEQEPAAAVAEAEVTADSGSTSVPQVAGEGERGGSAPGMLGGLGQNPKSPEDLQMEAEILETQVQVKAAMVKKAEAQRSVAVSELARLTRRGRSATEGFVSREEIEQARSRVTVADADVEIAKAGLEEVELRRKYARQNLARMSAALKRDDRFDATAKAEWEKAQREWQVMAERRLRRTEATGNTSRWGEVNSLKQIGLALHNYANAPMGRFPGPAILSADGKPLLSWRVAILPYLDAEALYKEFKLDEPWDSEHNKRLIARIPPVYALGQPETGETRFQAVVGSESMWGKPEGVGFPEILDGTSNTVAVVMADKGVIWTKPEDMWSTINPRPVADLFTRGALVLLADGSVRNVRPDDPHLIGALLSRAGGEVIDWERMGPAQAQATTRPAEVTSSRGNANDVRRELIEQQRAMRQEIEALRAENQALKAVIDGMRRMPAGDFVRPRR